jgi:hypothetical protein
MRRATSTVLPRELAPLSILLALAGAVGSCTLGASGTREGPAGAGGATTTGAGGAATTGGEGSTTTSGAAGHGGATAAGGSGGLGDAGHGGATAAGGHGGHAAGGGGTGSTGTGGGAIDAGADAEAPDASDAGGQDAAPPDAGDAGAVEDCTDGKDNDGNGKIDCADPACGAFECVPAAPQGWTGYFRAVQTPYPAANPPPCSGAAAPTPYFSGPAQAGCDKCACSGLSGATCATTLTCWVDSTSCSGDGGVDLTDKLPFDTCADVYLQGQSTNASCEVGTKMADSGSCSPSGGAVAPVQPWANEVDTCGQALQGGAGCPVGQVCVPRGVGPYATKVCIERTGTLDTCPDGWGAPVKAYAGGDDKRACSACDCSPGGTACTGFKYTVWDHTSCSSGPVDINDTKCHDESSNLGDGVGSIKLVTAPKASGGSCTPTGGAKSGSVETQGPITFCCQ